MSQTLILDNDVSPKIHIPSSLVREPEYQVYKQQKQQARASARAGNGSLLAAVVSTLLLRMAGRTSFVLLGFYLGGRFASATLVAVILEAFYLSELVLAPLVGGLSDRLGSRRFLLAAPLVSAGAALCLLIATRLFPIPRVTTFDVRLVALLLIVLVGRLLEGAAAALNTPASLEYITSATRGSERLRAQVMTAFEIATVVGLALAIPFGGKVSSLLGTWGFGVVLALHMMNAALLALCLKERARWQERRVQINARQSWMTSLSAIRSKRVFAFLPAWLSINSLVGAWLTLCTMMLTYPEPAARLRHPGQLLYGGFSQEFATLLLGGFGLLFLAGMGLWLFALPHLRRTTVMLISLGGLSASIIGLTFINSLEESQAHALPVLLSLVICGVLLLSGFTPASLNHMATIAELLPGKRGAVLGLYSVVMGVGQLIGAALGGLCVDLGGFYGLMAFSVVMGLVSLASVLAMRILNQDLLGNR